ncbi:hypothetical protein HanPI659440_Chr14g0549941 [Helianthus annuus]|nr:hypothetical protein HanPI659440_Chr14g0549941 [Helianthus annuus]
MRVKNSKGCGRDFRRKITLKNIFSWGAPAHPWLRVGTPLHTCNLTKHNIKSINNK